MTRVLLVADDASVARQTAKRLASDGSCEADCTTSVAEAIERLAWARFDLVVVDRAVDGLGVARALEARLARELTPAPVLVTPNVLGLEGYFGSRVPHVRYLVGVIGNAIEWQWAASPLPAWR